MPAQTICLATEKGGVGRTTTSLNVAALLARTKQRVLLIDCDAQASVSQFLLGPAAVENLHRTEMAAALFDDRTEPNPERVLHATKFEHLKVLPASQLLKPFLLPEPQKQGDIQFAIKEFIRDIRDDFDFIIIDTSPEIEVLPAWSALVAADYLVSIMQPEPFSFQACIKINNYLAQVLNGGNPRLTFLGYLINMRHNTKAHELGEQSLRQMYGDRVFERVIPKLTAFNDAHIANLPIGAYAQETKDAGAIKAYQLMGEVTREIVTRIQRTRSQRKAA